MPIKTFAAIDRAACPVARQLLANLPTPPKTRSPTSTPREPKWNPNRRKDSERVFEPPNTPVSQIPRSPTMMGRCYLHRREHLDHPLRPQRPINPAAKSLATRELPSLTA